MYRSFSFVGSKETMMVGVTRIVNACMPYAPRGPGGPLQGPVLAPHSHRALGGPNGLAPVGPLQCPILGPRAELVLNKNTGS